MKRDGLFLLGTFACTALAQEAEQPRIRLAVPEAWMRLRVPAFSAPAQAPRQPKGFVPHAIVEVLDRPPEASDRAIQLRLSAEARDVLRFPVGSLLASELGAFMAEAGNARPDFTKALLDASMDYWQPRRFHLDGLIFQSGRFGMFVSSESLGSSDTSRRGPVGR